MLTQIFSKIKNIGIKFVILLVVLLLLPIVFIGIAINLFWTGKASMPLPKKIVKNIINKSKEK